MSSSDTDPQASRDAKQRPTGARILLIDDEPEIRRAVRAGLSGAEFVIEWAPTAADCDAVALGKCNH